MASTSSVAAKANTPSLNDSNRPVSSIRRARGMSPSEATPSEATTSYLALAEAATDVTMPARAYSAYRRSRARSDMPAFSAIR